MKRLTRFFRLFYIQLTLFRYLFTPTVIPKRFRITHAFSHLNLLHYHDQIATRGEAMRISLEKLGPIFVKFGQMLSTRRDLFPDEISDELAKLQDQVTPFPGKIARHRIESSLKASISELFLEFDEHALASASIAQVHAAKLFDGTPVVIKVLRPNIDRVIQRDIDLLFSGARLLARFKKAKRLRPVELVREFEYSTVNELDLCREAANASQLRRNFEHSPLIYVPKIYWPYVKNDVMVMERIYGIRISDVDALKAANTDLKKLAASGVEIFFTQVLRDSFFHADMHPGNLFVDTTNPREPRYLGVDFGIMGSLSPEDQQYLAANLLAFFKRDYRQVAVLHIESGWVPQNTRVEQFEAAIRTVCEPIFEKPLKDISFGQLLLRLFRTAEQFNMSIQPQLLLLQKTLLSIEGLGRALYPDLDLWETAKPFLERWTRKQQGITRVLQKHIQRFGPATAELLETPTLFYEVLKATHLEQNQRRWAKELTALEPPKRNQKPLLTWLFFGLVVIGMIIGWHWKPTWAAFLQ